MQPHGPSLTLRVFERSEDLPLRCHTLDVWVIFQGQYSILLLLIDLDNLKITGILAGWVVARYNPPVLNITTLQCTRNKFASSFSCEVSIKSHNIFWNKSTTYQNLRLSISLMHSHHKDPNNYFSLSSTNNLRHFFVAFRNLQFISALHNSLGLFGSFLYRETL